MKITVVTVSYNSEKTIRDTIESVLNQNYHNIEYILIDGNSNDKTVNIIDSYEQDFKNKEIEYKWISEEDDGLYHAINKGIKMASGDVVGVLNSDDFFIDNNVITDISQSFKAEIDCVYGNLVYVKANDINVVCRRWTSKKFKRGLFEKSWTPAHPTFYCKRELYTKWGYYRTDFVIASDVELMYRFIDRQSARSLYINRIMVKMREGGVSNRGLKSTLNIIKELKISINENGGKFNLLKYTFYKFLKIKQLF